MEQTSLFNIYLEKQKKFVSLVKEIQASLNSKEYKNQGYSLAQYKAYRYLVCAKVIDQLDEFEIKPSYESLCKSLHIVAKSQLQMKLLWSTILKKIDGRPDCINSTHVNQYWKELCMNKKYSSICNYKNEKDIMAKIENSLNKFSNEKKHKQMNNKLQIKELKQNEKISQNYVYPSPTLSVASDITTNSNISVQSGFSEESSIYSNNNINYIYSTSPINNCINYVSNIDNNENSLSQSISYSIPFIPSIPSISSSETIYYLPNLQYQNQNQTELSYSYGQSIIPLTNF
eukprot:jgi/Orpsp1_1/1174083/evm.model.c7180000048847.1